MNGTNVTLGANTDHASVFFDGALGQCARFRRFPNDQELAALALDHRLPEEVMSHDVEFSLSFEQGFQSQRGAMRLENGGTIPAVHHPVARPRQAFPQRRALRRFPVWQHTGPWLPYGVAEQITTQTSEAGSLLASALPTGELLPVLTSETTASVVFLLPSGSLIPRLTEAGTAFLTQPLFDDPVTLSLGESATPLVPWAFADDPITVNPTFAEALLVLPRPADTLSTILMITADHRLFLNLVETVPMPLVEAGAALVQTVPQEALALVFIEATGQANTVTAAETVAIATAGDTALPVILLTLPESLPLRLLEDPNLWSFVAPSGEPLAVLCLDTALLSAIAAVTDSTPLTLGETVSQLSTTILAVAEGLGLSLAEAETLLALMTPLDLAVVLVSEGSTLIANTSAVVETLRLSTLDAAVLLALVAPFDLALLAFLEGTDLAITQVSDTRAVVDTIRSVLAEQTAAQVVVGLEDIILRGLDDQLLLVARTMELSETLALPLAEQFQVLSLLSVSTETLGLSLDEAAGFVRAVVAADLLPMLFTEDPLTVNTTIAEDVAFTHGLFMAYQPSKTPTPFTIAPKPEIYFNR
jgi:hypothetical protein